MPRLLHRLSAVRVKTLKEPGYYADGGNLYLQVTRAALPEQGDATQRARTQRARLTSVIPETVHLPAPVAGAAGPTEPEAARNARRAKVPSATKSWIFRFTLRGRTRDMGLGQFPAVSLNQAREMAERCRWQLAEGRDPIKVRDDERKAAEVTQAKGRTFEQCAEPYIETHGAGWRNTKHRQQWTTIAQDLCLSPPR